jgi:sec-independent protein translocase protein TatB
MFDIGFGEIILVLVIAILVLKPEDVPLVIRTVAKFIAHIKAWIKSIQNEVDIKLYEMESYDTAMKEGKKQEEKKTKQKDDSVE